MSKTNVILDWLEASQNLKHWKAKEAMLRAKIVEDHFPNSGEGTQTGSFRNFNLKAVIRYNYTLNQAEFEEAVENNDLSDNDWDNVTTKYSVTKTQFHNLDDDSALASCVEVKPGLPTLSIEIAE